MVAVSFTIFSCQKEYSFENGTGGSNVTAQWSFSEGGVQYKGPIDTVSVDTVGSYLVLSVNGHSDDKQDLINLEVFGTQIKVGTYKTPYCLFAYARNGVVRYQTNQTAVDSFTINITKLDSTGIIGTFSGKAYDTAKNYKTIVDGKFSAVFKTATTTPPASTDSGQVVFWGKADCKGTTAGTENITINGKNGSITKYLTAEPSTCDPAGSYNIKLPVGSYPWVAKCGTDSITGTVTVTKGGCTKVQVDFTAPPVTTGDYFPTTLNSYWTNLYENGSAGDTTYQLSTSASLTANGNKYNVFYYEDDKNGTVDSVYFRKANGVYYQYVKTYANVFDTPIPFEYIFLKDNVATGSTWSASISGTASGTAIKLQLNGSILEKASSATVGGKTYNDVIKVRLIVMATVGPSPVAVEASRIDQWFAKGIGLIKEIQYNAADPTKVDNVLNIIHYKVY